MNAIFSRSFRLKYRWPLHRVVDSLYRRRVARSPSPPPSSVAFPQPPAPCPSSPPLMSCSYDLQLHGGSPLGIATLSTPVGIKSLPRSRPRDRPSDSRVTTPRRAPRRMEDLRRPEDSKSPITRRKKRRKRKKENGELEAAERRAKRDNRLPHTVASIFD